MMSKLDELIQKYCPNGVQYKKTKDIVKDSFWLMPSTPKFKDNGIHYITSKNIRNGKITFKDAKFITEDDYNNISKNRPILKGDILITMIGTIGEVSIVDTDIKFYGQNIYLLRLNNKIILNKFYYYFITSNRIKTSLISKKNASSQGYIKAGSIENLSIPLPPLPVQEEIVRILDSFTKLNEELNEELTKRKNQYEYYRDNLLSFKDKSIYLPLEQILKIKNGKDYKHLNIGKIPVYGTGGIITYVDKYTYNKPSVLIPRKGSLEKLYYLDTPFWNVDTVFYTEIFNNVVEKYVFYCLQKEHLEKLNTAGGVPSLTQRVLNKVRIPVPSLDKQKYIVSILDKFNILCNDLLPAEIEARKKQYEYYRDKLLTFKELKQ